MGPLTHVTRLISTSCWCGVPVGIPESLYNEAQDSGKAIYCPVGHTFVYGNTFKEKLAEEQEARLRAELRARANRDLLRAEERSHAGTRGHLTRVKKRTAHGVCPCCNRTFQNVARHMESKHPEFVQGVA